MTHVYGSIKIIERNGDNFLSLLYKNIHFMTYLKYTFLQNSLQKNKKKNQLLGNEVRKRKLKNLKLTK